MAVGSASILPDAHSVYGPVPLTVCRRSVVCGRDLVEFFSNTGWAFSVKMQGLVQVNIQANDCSRKVM
jgi:hypothetical protein